MFLFCIFVFVPENKEMKSIIAVLVFLSFSAMNLMAQNAVDVHVFEKGISKDVQLLDVRTQEEFNQGHLANAMLADWNEKDEFVRRIDAMDKNQPVYIYCLSGRRSAAAASLLREKGFFQVTEMEGGINAWKQADKPLEGAAVSTQISNDSYQAMLGSSSLVLVDFGALWCPPCRKMEPVLKEIEKENPAITLIRIDAGSQPALMKANQVSEMPTYVLYKEGTEVWRTTGLTEKGEISAAINKYN
jgi:rhodanese-related sulfurtransferase